MLAKQEHERIAAKLANGSLPPDEPLFTLRARDMYAATTVLFWSDLVEAGGAPLKKFLEARELAKQMDLWPVKRVPGRDCTPPGQSSNEENNFRAKLKFDRDSVLKALMSAKVEEWMNDGAAEVIRCLTNWAAQRLDLGDDDTIVELAEGRL